MPLRRRIRSLAVLLVVSAGAGAHRLDHEHQTDAAPASGFEAAGAPSQIEGGGAIEAHGTAPERVRGLIARYRETGDDRLLDRGWLLLQPALDSEATNPATLLAAAWLAQAGHAFDRAQSYLRHVVLLRPDHGEAWLLRASVALVQGDVERAREACDRTTLTVPVVVTAACFARVDAHTADAAGTAAAYRRLAAILAAGTPAEAGLLTWLHGVAADLAARGAMEAEAEHHYRAALDLAPSVSLRAGFADLLLATGRAEAVLGLIGPEHTAPALVLRRLLAEKHLGLGPSAERLKEVSAQFQAWVAIGDLRHAREMALFYLQVMPDPARAYRLARQNYQVQREPEDRALLCEAEARFEGIPDPDFCRTAAQGLPLIRALSSAASHDH